MTKVPDRKKLRREYMMSKTSAFVWGTVCGALFFSTLLLTLALDCSGAVMIGILFVDNYARYAVWGTSLVAWSLIPDTFLPAIGETTASPVFNSCRHMVRTRTCAISGD